jgi:DNA-binding MarR family transcriptional regulator
MSRARLEELFDEIRRLAEPPAKPFATDLPHAALARTVIRLRAMISDHLNPRLFGDPAFDLLLELFASGEEKREVQTTHCAHAARLPETTSLRWLAVLEREALIERYADARDGRRVLVRLTPGARNAIRLYLDRVAGGETRPMN